MIKRDLIENNLKYIMENDRLDHEMFVALMILEMNVPLEWLDNNKLEEISKCVQDAIDNESIYNKSFLEKIMNIEKKVEYEKIPNRKEEIEEALEK